ncbi:MAG TPA: PepSY-associated TM helix domain-containing protein [Fimbriimonadaceae bacterium]|nr:PepSY-associated TM helix domain-containing protein [Fimbriimonadaceae bacterium]
MFRSTRALHRWIGIFAALFLAVIAVTGFLLATKDSFGWVRPPEADGAAMEALDEVISLHTAAEAAFQVGIPELKSHKDISRIDYRPGSNVFKVLSKEGYHEVQVDGSSGKVLQVAKRTDQLAEDIHDLSFFSDLLKRYGLPLVAIVLLGLAISGVGMFLTPILRRRRFRRDKER